MDTAEDISGLVEEYCTLFQGADRDSPDSLSSILIHDAEWTPQAAAHLLELAQAYGAFMLRNAFAISLAINMEDGELGF